ncbi:uncharacterized protein LOC132747099 [Ruditapes philippinarum]|uniref:uncharacterized protein LOC132747099 n=1 Tax=Ruditapes philippinarum TaxID=129788 RepID=UPI00295B1F5B|nr:uncharacterized protein LOC132747099 [Ruditapes philippinarum]
MCQVHYKAEVDQKYLTVHIIEKANKDNKNNDKQKNTGQASDKFIIWIILGACVLVVGIIVIAVLFVVIRKKRLNSTEKRDSQVDYHKHEDDIVFSKQNPEVRPLGNLNQNAHALENEAEVPVYSQPVKKKTIEDSDNTYAQVNKTGTSASSSKTEKPKHSQDGQLLYADLAFDSNETPSKAAVAKRRDSPTEYADIDYVKTKTNKGIDDTPTEQDNIYANQ